MATTETNLIAEKRSETGTAQCRRLRKKGRIPGNIYGHKEAPLMITVSATVFGSLVRARRRVLDLELEGVHQKALLREVQWDAFGDEIQHFDLLRIDTTERVTLEVPIDLRGTAPGTLSGGVLDFHLHSLTIECLAVEIPDSILVRIGELQTGQAIHVKEVELPANMKCLNDEDQVVVQVVLPRVVDLAAAADTGPSQPEVIGKKAEEEAEE